MDGRRCAGALDEPAANQVGVSPLLRRVATQTPDLYRVKEEPVNNLHRSRL
jgi:hypothetical protein